MKKVVVLVFIIQVTCGSLDPACFPGCKIIELWSSCVPHNNALFGKGVGYRPSTPQEATCILCTTHLQQQSVLDTAQPSSTCLPNIGYVAIRGFSFGILSVKKLRPPQQFKVKTLSLVECGITDIEEYTLAVVPQLRFLNLDFNNLTHVKQIWFTGLKFPKSMYSLSFSHNNISTIDSNCFETLTALNILLLDSNSLRRIEPSWFYKLDYLGHLSLKSNFIKSIHSKAFTSLSQLTHLDLSNNPLWHLPTVTVKGMHKLNALQFGGNKFPPFADSALLMTNWSLDYRHFLKTEHLIAVTVNEDLFCITQPFLMRRYHVLIQHDFITQLARPNVEPRRLCTSLNVQAKSKLKSDLPLMIIFMNMKSEKQVENITGMCKNVWKDAGGVNFALGRLANLRIVPICVDKHSNSQGVAVVLYDAAAGKHGNENYSDSYSRNVTTVFGHKKAMNVTCLLKTARGETYQHVFTTTLSDTPVGASCVEEMGIEHMEGAEGTRIREIDNQTNPYTTRTVTVEPGRGVSLHVRLITLSTVLLVALVTLIPACFVRKYCCFSLRDQAVNVTVGSPRSLTSLNQWMISGAGSHVVTLNVNHSTTASYKTTGTRVTQQASYSGDEQQYSEIPDEYYKYQNTDTLPPEASRTYWQIPDNHYSYYNTRPASVHHYWEIGDEYYNYENTGGRPLSFPLTLQVPLTLGQDFVPFTAHASASEVAIPTVKGLGRKPSFCATAAHTYHVSARTTHIPSYTTNAPTKRRVRDMVLVGKYGRIHRSLNSCTEALTIYTNPYSSPEQFIVMHEATSKLGPLKKATKRNHEMSYPQEPNMHISKDEVIKKREKGQIDRSKTLCIKSTNDKSQTDESSSKSRHRSGSI